MKENRSHIVLVGFMGSGKSTIGRLLAHTLNMKFVDTDLSIEGNEGKSISQIFQDHGEAYFREIEHNTLVTSLTSDVPSVISTGGGAPCHHGNMQMINDNAYSVYLQVGAHRLAQRLKNDKNRPLLANKNEKSLLAFVINTLRLRSSIYKLAHRVVRASDSPQVIVSRIIKRIMFIDSSIKIIS